MGGKGSGRLRKAEAEELRIQRLEKRTIYEVIHDASVDAINYLADVAKKTVSPNWARINVCEYLIDHEIGKARQKTELTGADGKALTLAQLILMVSGEQAAQVIEGKAAEQITKEAESLKVETEAKEE